MISLLPLCATLYAASAPPRGRWRSSFFILKSLLTNNILQDGFRRRRQGIAPNKTEGRRGIPTKIPRTEKGEQKSKSDKASKIYLQWVNRGPQGSHLRRGNGIPSGSIHRNYQCPDELCRAEVCRSSGHPNRNRESEGSLYPHPNYNNGHIQGSGKAPP